MKRQGRLLALVLTIILAGSSVAANAATIKAGATCTKAGLTKIYSGKKYTCIKSGKKYIWNKGVAVIAAPKPSPTPIATAPAQPLTFDNLDTKWVREIAYDQIAAGVANSTNYVPNITYVIGPSLTAARVDQEKQALNRTSSFWSDIFKPSQVFIGYFTEKDVDWVDSAMCSQARYCPSGGSVVISKVIKDDTPWCNSAMATNNNDGVPFFDQCLGNGSDAIKNRQTGPHEYTHWVQQANANWSWVPNWWTEGSADYFGNTLGIYNGPTLPTQLDEMSFTSSYNWVRQDLCPMPEPTVELIAKCFRYTYNGGGAPPGNGNKYMLAHVSYYMGGLATEAMIAVKGLATFKAFTKDLKSITFDTAFEKHYGLTADEFYPKVAKYVLAMYQQKR